MNQEAQSLHAQIAIIEDILNINQDLGIIFAPSFTKSQSSSDHSVQGQPANRSGISPALLYINSLGVGSRPAMVGALERIAAVVSNEQCTMETMPWWLLRAPHVKVIRSWLQEEYAPATANKYLAALRQTLQNCWELDLMSTDDYMRASAVKNIKFKRPESAAGRHISYQELSAILSTCMAKKTNSNIRDAAIISLAYAAGLRRAEIANLRIGDYDPRQSQLVIANTKHNSTRIVPTEATSLNDMIGLWLEKRFPIHGNISIQDAQRHNHFDKETQQLPLFCRILKSGQLLVDQSISPTAVSDVIIKRATAIGITDITPHDFRRTFAGDLLDAGADIATVQKLMGHASSDTTASYDRRGERARRTAIAKLKLPLPR